MKIHLSLLALALLAVPVFGDDAAPKQNQHLRVIQTEELQYPLEMKATGVRIGTVRAALHIDSTGHLADFLVVAYTKKPFADAVTRAVQKWKFEPEYVDGAPVDSVIQMDFNFRVDGIMLVQRLLTDLPRSDADDDRFEFEARTLKNLDHIPTPINVIRPSYPKAWADQGVSGAVVVDFYIDEQGKVRLPAALAGSNPLLAGPAVSAVEQWQFNPPTYRGRPVLVHVQQRFTFQ